MTHKMTNVTIFYKRTCNQGECQGQGNVNKSNFGMKESLKKRILNVPFLRRCRVKIET